VYKVEIARPARRDLDHITGVDLSRLEKHILALEMEPRPHGANSTSLPKKLSVITLRARRESFETSRVAEVPAVSPRATDACPEVGEKEFLKANPGHPSLQFKKIGNLSAARVGLSYRVMPNSRVQFYGGMDAFKSGQGELLELEHPTRFPSLSPAAVPGLRDGPDEFRHLQFRVHGAGAISSPSELAIEALDMVRAANEGPHGRRLVEEADVVLEAALDHADGLGIAFTPFGTLGNAQRISPGARW